VRFSPQYIEIELSDALHGMLRRCPHHYQTYLVSWTWFNPDWLSGMQHTTTSDRPVVGFCGAKAVQMAIPLFSGKFDALNRIRKACYPQDFANHRKVLEPKYNKGGALDSLKLVATKHVAAAAERSTRK